MVWFTTLFITFHRPFYNNTLGMSFQQSFVKTIQLLLFLVLLIAGCRGHAVQIQINDTRQVGKIDGVLSSPFQFSNACFCLTSVDDEMNTGFLCTFDGGSSFNNVDVSEDFCGANGVILDGNLFCPNKLDGRVDGYQASFGINMYSPADNGFTHSTTSTVTTLDFKESGVLAEEIIFGSSVFVESKNEFYRAATLKHEDQVHSCIFRSSDGLQWSYASELPFHTTQQIHVFSRGSYVGVAYGSNDTFKVSFSKDLGKWLPAQEQTVLPQVGIFSSGLVAESGYADGNATLSIRLSVLGVPGKKVLPITEHHNAAFPNAIIHNDTKTSVIGNFPLGGDNEKILLTVYQVCSSNDCLLFSMRTVLDDYEEMKIKEQRAEELQRKAEAKQKAAEEARERRRKMEAEREKKRQEKKKVFDEYDAPFISSARQYQEKDGEMIVVRQGVSKQFVEFEKESFFV